MRLLGLSFDSRFHGSRASAAILALTFLAALSARAQDDDVRLPLAQTLDLIDGRGQPVKTTDFPGKWLFVYFGYTHCADLCPWGLTVMADALDQIGPATRHLQPLFVTVDPERDHGPMLIEFTRSFHDKLLGLTGTQAQIRAAANAMGVKFQRVVQGADYSVDHSSSYSLIGPDRKTVLTFRKAEAHMVAAKIIDVLGKAGASLEGVNNIGAFR